MAAPGSARASGLVMDVREGDTLVLGPHVQLVVLKKSGRLMRLRILAPLDMRVAKESTAVDRQSGGPGAMPSR